MLVRHARLQLVPVRVDLGLAQTAGPALKCTGWGGPGSTLLADCVPQYLRNAFGHVSTYVSAVAGHVSYQ